MLTLLLLPLVFAFDIENDYNIENGNCGIPECLDYYDGCNNCFCNIENGLSGCTLQYCETYTSSFCTNCDKDRVWLVVDDKTSACSCPEGETVTDNGCETIQKCPDPNEKLLRCNYPTNDTECTHNGLSFRYQICQSDRACEHGFHCKKVDQDLFYDTCTPIMCKLDVECNPYDCVDDCIGIGWGTCVPDEFMLCDKIPHCISYNNECVPGNTLDDCTMNICSNAIKSDLCVDDSECHDGFECQIITDGMDFIESDLCVSLDCNSQMDICQRYACLSSCIDTDNVGTCVVVNDGNNNIFQTENTEVESAHKGDVFNLDKDDNRLYNDLQYNFLIVAIQLVALILCCLFVGITVSYYGFNFKSVSVLVITICGFIGVFVMIFGVKSGNGKLYWNFQHNFIIIAMQIMIVALCCLSVGVAIILSGLNYNKQLKIKGNKQILEDL